LHSILLVILREHFGHRFNTLAICRESILFELIWPSFSNLTDPKILAYIKQ